MKKFLKILLLVLISILAISYVGYQIFMVTTNSVSTETATRTTTASTIEGKGVAFREESVIDVAKENITIYEIDAGEKIAKDSVVANMYASESDAANKQMISSLTNKMKLLQAIQSGMSNSNLQPEVISGQILTDIGTIRDFSNRNVVYDSGVIDSLVSDLIKKNALVDNTVNLSSQISQLENEINTLSSKVSSNVKTVKTPVAGYFVSTVDGLEEKCKIENIGSYSAQEILEISQGNKAETSEKIGKIITSYVWNYAAVVDTDKVKDLKVGTNVSISFSFTEVNNLPATIDGIKEDKDGKSIVYIKSTGMSAPISNIRTQDIIIKTKTYSGIRVPKNAIHVIDGKQGVYIKINNIVHFRLLDIIYETETFVLSAPGTSGGDTLRVYDDIVIDGKDLHDGKVF